MTKGRIVLLAFVFLVCAGLGFLAANEVGLFIPAAIQAATEQSKTISGQQNFLLIHADDLTADQPSLVSLWLMIYVDYDPPQLAFKTLYPPLSPDENVKKISNTFRLSSQGSPDEDFLKAVRESNMHWESYILVDHRGIQDILGNPEKNLAATLSAAAGSAHPAATTLQMETAILKAFCARLAAEKGESLDISAWSALIPTHLRTDLHFETIMINWHQLTAAQTKPGCRVFGSP